MVSQHQATNTPSPRPRWRDFILLAVFALAAGALLFLSLGGCIAFYGGRSVDVSVKDAETGQPIPNAKVSVGYRRELFGALNSPGDTERPTGEDGTARVGMAIWNGQYWGASADGYIPTRRTLRGGTKPQHAVDFVLYRKPVPLLRLVVPNGYHGPVTVELAPMPGYIQGKPGARQFEYRVSEDGQVRIDATPLLLGGDAFMPLRPRWGMDGKMEVVYADGTPIPMEEWDTPSDAIVLRDLPSDRTRYRFVIGSRQYRETTITTMTRLFGKAPSSQPATAPAETVMVR